MIIREVRLSNVRSYEQFSSDLSPNTTLILGKNGSGKTTILESLYFLMQGTSFRGRDADMVAHSSTRTELQIHFLNDEKRHSSLQIEPNDCIKKVFKVDGKQSARLPAKHRLPVVLFEPDELRLLTSSPERRRRFFDTIIAHIDTHYAANLRRYQRILAQRNELLKQYREATSRQTSFRGRSDVSGFTPDTSGGVKPLLNHIEDQLFAWDIQFAELATKIVSTRRDFIERANAELSTLYSELAGSPHSVVASYHSKLKSDNYQQQLHSALNNEKIADSYRGYTSHGPHRDDVLLSIDGHLTSETASRGELRTIMLAFKLFEVAEQQRVYGQAPLILLDDVFSELDASREIQLITALNNYQTIITATDVRNSLKSDASQIIQL